MRKPLLNETLLKSLGCSVKDNRGHLIGKITEVTRDTSGIHIEYMILKSNVCFGRGERIFAIPASSALIKIADNETVILLLSKDELQFAKGVAADKCPKPNLKVKYSFFELYNYKEPPKNPVKSA